jgi:large subunit ribosomal protein L15
MRIPKFGFRSRIGLVTAEVRLSELNKVEGDVVNLESLKAANVVRKDMKRARIMLSGEVGKALKVEDAHIAVTKGARAAIETAGGQVVDVPVPEKGRLQKKDKAAETA